MKNVMLSVLFTMCMLFPWDCAYADNFNLGNEKHQVRVAIGFGASYVLKDVLRKHGGLSHGWSALTTLVVVVGGSLALDMYEDKSLHVNEGNQIATGIGSLAGVSLQWTLD